MSAAARPPLPKRTPTPPHVWKNPIQLIRFFEMDQFLISGASDYGQYHCRWEDSCRTAVFIYRNVCFLLYADGEAGNGERRPLHHCSPWPVSAGVWPPHARLQQQHQHRGRRSAITLRSWILWIFIHVGAERWISLMSFVHVSARPSLTVCVWWVMSGSEEPTN